MDKRTINPNDDRTKGKLNTKTVGHKAYRRKLLKIREAWNFGKEKRMTINERTRGLKGTVGITG